MTAAPSIGNPPPRCLARIDLAALRHNAAVCRKLAGPHCGIMAIVKADAYGHGLEECVAALGDEVAWFGVANLHEARRVRASNRGRETGILVLGPAAPEEVPALVAEGFAVSVSQLAEVRACAAAAERVGKPAHLHAVVDTGMGRMGCQPADFADLVDRIRGEASCRLEGLASHFPSADEDDAFTRTQIGRFHELVTRVAPDRGCEVHLGNSAGLLGFQAEMPFATLVRPGLALYGVSPLSGHGSELRSVLRWETRVTLVRDVPSGTGISYGRTYIADRPLRVATLAAGYADGYPRHLSGAGAEVLIGGRRCPLLGRVTMDQIVVDVSAVPSVAAGDEAVLLGRQGAGEITAAELATKAGTIPWEILTGITGRVERVHA